jgi:hypothetical protein
MLNYDLSTFANIFWLHRPISDAHSKPPELKDGFGGYSRTIDAVNGPIRILVYNTLFARIRHSAKPRGNVLVRRIGAVEFVMKRLSFEDHYCCR